MSSFLERFPEGKSFQAHLQVDAAMVERFAEFSGDKNPIHIDSQAANSYGYSRQVAHGAILVAMLSKMIGMNIPGPGALWMNQAVDWLSPVYVGDEINLIVVIKKVSEGAQILTLNVQAKNQKGKTVMTGKANVRVSEKLTNDPKGKKKTMQTALITGSSRGVGAAIARRLAAQGIHVALHYHESKNETGQLAQEIKNLGAKAKTFQADLTDTDQLSKMLDEVQNFLGPIDIVIHGASPMVPVMKVHELSYETVDQFFKVYVGGALMLISRLSPQMMERKFGRFIFLGTSFMFGIPPAGLAAYISAKEALWGIVKSAAAELGPFGITANMVSPSMMITDFTSDISARLKELEARKSPVRRLATVEDAAEAVAFLAFGAPYVNGMNLPVTGGPI